MITTDYNVSDIYRNVELGSIKRAMGESIHGFNLTNNPVQTNQNLQGKIFFVRPQLNLTSSNIRADRELAALLNPNPNSIHRIIRNTLDPRLHYLGNHISTIEGKIDTSKVKNGFIPVRGPFVDPKQCFIPMMTNSLKTLTGWRNREVSLYVEEENLYGAAYMQVDSHAKMLNKLELSATFDNMPGNPLIHTLDTWVNYSALSYEGIILPYPDMWLYNEIEYNTRVWNVILDPTETTVQDIYSSGPAIITSVGIGAGGDYNREEVLSEANNEFTVNITAAGQHYNDPILLKEFNDTVKIFNPQMRDAHRSSQMVIIEKSIQHLFNGYIYPRIENNLVFNYYADKIYAEKVYKRFDQFSRGDLSPNTQL